MVPVVARTEARRTEMGRGVTPEGMEHRCSVRLHGLHVPA